MQELLARASVANRDAQLQHVQTQRIQVRALNHKLGMDRVELVRRYARVQHSKAELTGLYPHKSLL